MAIAKAIAEPLLLLIFLPLCAEAGWPLFWLLFSTPGILPAALRAGFAVRARSGRARGHAEKSDSVAEGERNAVALPSTSDAPISPPTRPFGFTGNPKRSFSYEIFGSLNVQTPRMVAIQLPQRNTGRIRFPQPWPDRP